MTTTFGHARLADWPLDPQVTYLNHGTVGVVPRRVLARQHEILDQIERQPALYLFRAANHTAGKGLFEVPGMRRAAAEVAEFLGGRGEDLVFVDNATAGVNAVVRSLPWAAGDEIVVTDHSYGAVTIAARGITRDRGVVVREVAFPDPATRAEQIVDAILAAIGPRTKLAILDHITSGSALVLPIGRLVRECHARGVPVLVDGAHAPGALPVDLGALGADWYTGNLHKWALAPRSCGVLWAPKERQPGLHPPVLSWGYDQGFTAEFDWMGTRDPSAWLASTEGIRMLREFGLDALRAYNHDLAWRGAHRLAEGLGTRFDVEEAMVGCMATVPLPARFGAGQEAADRLRDALLFEDGIEVPVIPFKETLSLRISAQVYNEMADVEKLAEAVAKRS